MYMSIRIAEVEWGNDLDLGTQRMKVCTII